MMHGKMSDNPHLSKRRRQKLYRTYGKTRLGKAELEGEYYEGIEGALWNTEMFKYRSYSDELLNQMVMVVVAVDPSVTSTKRSNETGIACIGRDAHRTKDGLLAELTSSTSTPTNCPRSGGQRRPTTSTANSARMSSSGKPTTGATSWSPTSSVNPNLPFEKVTASRGKYARAEEAALLYDAGRVYHVGHFERAEERMCAFISSDDNDGDDEVDADTWGLKKLNTYEQPAEPPQIVGVRTELESFRVY